MLFRSDVDGSHIRTLLLTFFYRYMTPLVDAGHLFIAQPPLFRVSSGSDAHWCYSDAQRDQYVSELQKMNRRGNVTIQRYKGLGEMNPEQLWETTMNPETRTVLQVEVQDSVEAAGVFDMLMGESVPPRKRFIQTHARGVRNLDV